MSCPPLSLTGSAGLAEALASLDCRTGETTQLAFGRLFGAQGALLPALTILLTFYVAFFAIGLLTGRTRIGVGALTPRMLTLGLALTFATSWMAYQNVVWTLATGAPDQIASVLAGTHGSATRAFAVRLDRLFAIVADAAQQSSVPAAPTETGVTPAPAMAGGFTATTVLWLSAMMLLLGTVGVLVTAKIALAALLAIGPVFVVMALFPATRGLFEGWLKGVVMFALTPLMAVLIGGGMVAALEPVARSLAMDGAQPSTRGVTVMFLGASIYLALMVMAVKTAGVLVSGWRLPGSRERQGGEVTAAAAPPAAAQISATATSSSAGSVSSDPRVRAIVAGLPAPANDADRGSGGGGRAPALVRSIDTSSVSAPSSAPRPAGVGSRFRSPPRPISRDRLT